MDWLMSVSPDLIPPAQGYGDWLCLDDGTPKELLGTAYFARNAELMCRMIRAIGQDGASRDYASLAERVREAFARQFVAPDGKVGSGTQTAQALAIMCGLVEGEAMCKAGEHLVHDIEERGCHFATGFVGLRELLPALTRIGRSDVAYRILLKEDYPSWGYQIRHGATTMWERWDGWTDEKGFQTPVMNSFNHYAFGSVGEWLFAVLGGIEIAKPGCSRFRIQPVAEDGVSFAKCSWNSIRGVVSTAWQSTPDEFSLACRVPPCSTAEIRVPATRPGLLTSAGVPLSEAHGLDNLRSIDGGIAVDAAPGLHHLVWKPQG